MGPHRTARKRKRDLAQAVQRALLGESQKEIAQALGVSRAQVSRDLDRRTREWTTEAEEDYAVFKEAGLPGLARMERELWQSYKESKRPKETTQLRGSRRKRSYRTTTVRSIRPAEGDPRILRAIIRSVHTRSQVLGLNGPWFKRWREQQTLAQSQREREAFLRSADTSVLVSELARRYGSVEVRLGAKDCERPDPRPLWRRLDMEQEAPE